MFLFKKKNKVKIYRILNSKHPWDLASDVNDLIGEGWNVQGGVEVSRVKLDGNAHQSTIDSMYLQAMIKG